MNPEFQSIIQAELDGTASAEDVARLEAAAAVDAELRSLRVEHAEIARAVSRLPAPDAPLGFTDRVLAALPPERAMRTSPSIAERIRTGFREFVPVRRHQVAFAFALGVVVTLAVGLVLTDLTPPRPDSVSATLSGRPATAIQLSGGAGSVTTETIDNRMVVTITPSEARMLRVAIQGISDPAPNVFVEPTSDPVSVSLSGDTVVLEAARTGAIRFTLDPPQDVRIRIHSAEDLLADWTTIPPQR